MDKRKLLVALAVVAGLLAITAIVVSAGTVTLSISGVTYECGDVQAPLEGVTVTIKGTGVVAVSGADGGFTLAKDNFPEGIYDICAVKDGYDEVCYEDVELVDTDGDGNIDGDDLFEKNNFRQVNFVGDYCLKKTVPAKYPGMTAIQLPVLYTTDGWETWIHVQNVYSLPVKAVLFLYAESNGFCKEQSEGLLKITCSGLIQPGAAWPFKIKDFAEGDFRSALVVSVQPGHEPVACGGDGSGITFCSALGEVPLAGDGGPLAVTVQRTKTDADFRSSIYKGIPDDAEYGPDPRTGAYMYYVPLVFKDGGGYGWTSDIWIQNSGCECTSVEIWYQEQGNCEEWEVAEIPALAQGESALAPKPSWSGIGSAWIRSSVPLGIVVDAQDAAKTQLLTYTGFSVQYEGEAYPGALENYGPLIYREYNGWDSGVQVQNLSSTTNALVKVYFLDGSGDIITTLVDWICKRGAMTFYLPAINNLPGPYVGQFRVHSQNWQTPGDPEVKAPKVLSVVNLINYNTGQGLSYNALPAWQAWDETKPFSNGVTQIALPFLVKQKHDPFEPTGSTWTSKIALTNLVHMSALSDVVVRIDFYDQNGLLYSICQKLNPKDVDYIDLDNYGVIPPGWLGSAVITVQCVTPFPGDPAAIGAVVVNQATGYASGDLTTGYEAFPILEPNLDYWQNPDIFPPCIECP